MPWASQTRTALLLRGVLFQRWPYAWTLVAGLALSAAIVVAAYALRVALSPWLDGVQFVTFFPAVILATLLCGTIPGMFAVVLSAAMALPFFGSGARVLEALPAEAMFVGVATMDVAIISAMLGANSALRASLAEIRALNEKVIAGDARVRNLIETAPDAMVIVNGDQRIVIVNAETERMFGYSREEMVGQSIDMLMPPEFRGVHDARLTHFLAQPRIKRMGYGRELFGLQRNGVQFPIETNLSLLAGGDEVMVSAAIRDITARREAEERQGLLIRELNHRVKNTLASVQAIVTQTLKSAVDAKAFSEAFTARLAALSQSHDVLTRNDWIGAGVREIVAEQLNPYERSGERRVRSRFELAGPEARLSPNRAVTLGMVIGELATNAAKYGALSNGGTVTVNWALSHRAGAPWLRLTWRELGGPPVSPPSRTGFGTRLIERSLTGALAGAARLDYAADGLVCHLEFPLQAGEA